MPETYDCLSLFSAGLDSILAARVLMAQGLRVKCLHFVSPFFGDPGRIPHWERVWGLDITAVDISAEFTALLRGPAHGFGKLLNPCMDCKILMLTRARADAAVRRGVPGLGRGGGAAAHVPAPRRHERHCRDAQVKACSSAAVRAQARPTPMESPGW
jgi:hypothetical protein